jgi:hypothetical protein
MQRRTLGRRLAGAIRSFHGKGQISFSAGNTRVPKASIAALSELREKLGAALAGALIWA